MATKESFPRTASISTHSPKFWVKEKDRYLRQLLIADIEAVTKRPLCVYFAQLDQQINHTDPDDLTEILAGIEGDEVDLFIQTPGGIVDATEKMVSVLRQRLKSWRVIVPSWAKSAGTVIALSASEIVLGINSELGPIDPQIIINIGPVPCELLARDQQLPQHQRELFALMSERMQGLAFNLLKRGMMSKKTDKEITELLAKISKVDGYKSHGAVIDASEAKNLGLSTVFLKPDDELWTKLWLLYCMYDYDTKEKKIGRIIEGSRFSISRAGRNVLRGRIMRDIPLYLLVTVLAVFQFGWVFWPRLGTYWAVLNAGIMAMIIVAALITKMLRR